MDYHTILKEMTLDEKFHYLTGGGLNNGYRLERFPIEMMRYHDGPFGLKMKKEDTAKRDQERIRSAFPNAIEGEEVPSTAFPTGSAMGASWDEDLVRRIGNALGEEFRFYGINGILGPAMNIKRHPLCGRNFEYFSEDPYLTGKLGSAYVKGTQEKGVAACPKHFAANNQENGRSYVSSEIDERTLREIYLKPFEITVKEAKPWSIMCSYNRINGVYASEHKELMNDILREEWGFDGMIISDWGAVHNRAYSLRASLEMCMPNQEEAYDQLKDAYEKGLIDDEMIDAAVMRIFKYYDRTKTIYEKHSCDFEAHHELAEEAARKSIVLLKNKDQVLPLKREKLKKVLVIGERAIHPFIGGDGSSRVDNPPKIDNPLEELKKILGTGTEVEFVGDDLVDTWKTPIGPMELKLAPKVMEADAVIIFANQQYSSHSEAIDRTNIELEPNMEYLIRSMGKRNPNTIVVLNVADAISTYKWEPYVSSILVSWLNGQGMGKAIAETLCGQNNPSGKLPETFPKRLEDVESLKNYPGDGYKVVYKERLMVGYRQFDTDDLKPEYEFGFGLSYTKFEFGDICLKGDELSFVISNTGNYDGEEVAQVYIEFPEDSWNSHPKRELKGFRKVWIPAGESKTVQIPLTKESFQCYNSALKKWTVEDGIYRIWVGNSSRNLPLCVEKKMCPEEAITNQSERY